ncbi:MAG TPA: LPS assembly protein LptD [Candidatus Xenobia bacterium]|nr:LPS assembly protein LptD [Candidatus Xenobia bacterium]
MNRLGPLSLLTSSALLVLAPVLAAQQPAQPPPSADIVEIFATSQQKSGDTFLLQGNVEIRYRGMRLTADEVTYNEKTKVAEARGNVIFERDDDRLEATEARYLLSTGEGTFHRVEGTVGAPPKPTNQYLVTTNPFYIEAEKVERHADGSYTLEHAWVTNCLPGKPKWRLQSARANVRPGKDVRLYHATFSIRGVPVLYSPYSAVSIADKPRQSGFLWPTFGNDSLRGTNFTLAYFWAISPQADLQVGGQFYNQGGWTQSATFRAIPTVRSRVEVNYFGAIADKLRRTQESERGIGIDQSGQTARIFAEALLPHGFRAVADLNFLSSQRFRLGFAETFLEAVQSEVKADAFLTNNPDTFYFNGYVHRYQNFFQAEPETSVTLFTGPGFDIGTRPRPLPWFRRQRVYYSIDAHAGGMHRDDPDINTPSLVQRFELYPRVSVPLRLGRYFGLTPTFGVRAMRYGSRQGPDPLVPGGLTVINRGLRRITGEVSVDVRFPSLERIFERGHARYKHVIEPDVTYRYRNGVQDFSEIIRFDERDIITNTNEVEYGITQRVYRKSRSGDAQPLELLRWRIAQKYFINRDFGDALQEGARNVFQSTIALTPFAYADRARGFSPIINSVQIMPGGRLDTDFRFDYDPNRHKVLNTRLGVNLTLTELVRVAVTHYTLRNPDQFQPRFNQLWVLATYGNLYRHGFNVAGGVAWDIRQDYLPSSVVQTSYNWDCCGVAFAFRRLGLGPLRSQNEYRFVFTIANVGSFGNLRPNERLF